MIKLEAAVKPPRVPRALFPFTGVMDQEYISDTWMPSFCVRSKDTNVSCYLERGVNKGIEWILVEEDMVHPLI